MNERDKELAEPWKWIGTEGWTFNHEADLVKFAALIRADEREACAKVCDFEWGTDAEKDAGMMFAAVIRARGNT
jgi:hypothetical protein